MRRAQKQSRPFAKRLRQEMTKAEVLLWSVLRRRGLEGFRFRRQHPIGPYIADFACISAKLVVEVDGATHWTAEQLAHDEKRAAYFVNQGWRIVRVTNADVYENLNGVWLTIADQLAVPQDVGAAPPPSSSAARPTLPPQAGEERTKS